MDLNAIEEIKVLEKEILRLREENKNLHFRIDFLENELYYNYELYDDCE